MFKIVGQAALGISLLQRAGIDPHPHQRGACGRGVLADDVAHPVGELAKGVSGVDWDVAVLESPDRRGSFGGRFSSGGVLRGERGGEGKR